MKQFLFIFSFLIVASFSADAQACSKAKAGAACCASKKASTTASTTNTSNEVADIAAASDENITKRVCEISGTSAYYQKSVCSTSGTVNWEEVEYDSSAKKFTKVASASMEKDAVTGEKVKTEGKACCAKGASAKACAGKDAGKKACTGESKEQ